MRPRPVTSGDENVKGNNVQYTDESSDLERVVIAKRRRVRVTVRKEPDSKVKKKTGYNHNGSKYGKILLDDILKTKDTNIIVWSKARKKAYQAIKKKLPLQI